MPLIPFALSSTSTSSISSRLPRASASPPHHASTSSWGLVSVATKSSSSRGGRSGNSGAGGGRGLIRHGARNGRRGGRCQRGHRGARHRRGSSGRRRGSSNRSRRGGHGRRAGLDQLGPGVGGGGAVRTSLSEALQDLEAAAATGPARLITTQDTRYAAHIAAGHTEGQARALADGERLAEGLRSWTVGNPISGPAGARRQTRAVCISELRAALSAIELSAAESDGEEVEEGPHRFDWESD